MGSSQTKYGKMDFLFSLSDATKKDRINVLPVLACSYGFFSLDLFLGK
jgi:hypothetical protein